MTSAVNRARRKEIAESTLTAIENGSFILNNRTIALTSAIPNTHHYAPVDLTRWPKRLPSTSPHSQRPQISILEISTLEAAQLLSHPSQEVFSDDGRPVTARLRVGVLNFASAKNPGGGFLSGAQAQEETIARSSTIYQSLTSPAADGFYSAHRRDARGGYYSHSIIWSPNITVFRNDSGEWHEPFLVDVVTSAAVNAGVVRKHAINSMQEENRIVAVMKERMARILFVFETQGVSKLVLGSFGTGVFRNSVPMVARLWAELLGLPDSRFAFSFEQVVFGILGTETYEEFKTTFQQTCR
ncbi:hypothetical protein JB92DRAFT_1361501 [Gautieria morchelliformis]|nr:hypothetical protein JB92DRAFT_1361501 [Gautieria morchelliformis]